MNRAKFLMLTALAVACAGFVTLSQPANARLMAPHGASVLAAIRLSDDAMTLTGLVVLVCSNHVICGR